MDWDSTLRRIHGRSDNVYMERDKRIIYGVVKTASAHRQYRQAGTFSDCSYNTSGRSRPGERGSGTMRALRPASDAPAVTWPATHLLLLALHHLRLLLQMLLVIIMTMIMTMIMILWYKVHTILISVWIFGFYSLSMFPQEHHNSSRSQSYNCCWPCIRSRVHVRPLI